MTQTYMSYFRLGVKTEINGKKKRAIFFHSPLQKFGASKFASLPLSRTSSTASLSPSLVARRLSLSLGRTLAQLSLSLWLARATLSLSLSLARTTLPHISQHLRLSHVSSPPTRARFNQSGKKALIWICKGLCICVVYMRFVLDMCVCDFLICVCDLCICDLFLIFVYVFVIFLFENLIDFSSFLLCLLSDLQLGRLPSSPVFYLRPVCTENLGTLLYQLFLH